MMPLIGGGQGRAPWTPGDVETFWRFCVGVALAAGLWALAAWCGWL